MTLDMYAKLIFPYKWIVSCSRYDVMLLCWSIDASERPKFSDLVITINGLLERNAGYLELSHKTDSSYLKNKSSPSATASDLPTVPEVEMVDESKEEVVIGTC